jgi:hypothetical protein
MQNPIDKMCAAYETMQSCKELAKFAEKCEQDRFEKDLETFISSAVKPAFAKINSEFFTPRSIVMSELPEQQASCGFKVEDFPGYEFLFWIKFGGKNGRIPIPRALRREIGPFAGGTSVSTQFFVPKPDYDLTDINKDIIVRAVADAYANSLPKI